MWPWVEIVLAPAAALLNPTHDCGRPGRVQHTDFRTDHGPKPYEFIGFGDIQGPKPYEFIGFGAMDVAKTYDFIGFGADRCTVYLPGWGLRIDCVDRSAGTPKPGSWVPEGSLSGIFGVTKWP